MYFLTVIGLLCCIFTTGDAIICGNCQERRSTDDVALNMTGANLPTCSSNLTEEECPANATSCVTVLTNIFLTPAAEPKVLITLTEEIRVCSSPDYPFPTGDVCLDQATVDSLTADLPSPPPVPPHLNMLNITFQSFSRSICVCDSSDNCIPPSPAKPSPEPAPGNGRSCITCTEVTSHDDDFPITVDSRIPTCSTNPISEACPTGVSSCMTLIVNASYTQQSGSDVVLTTKQRGCVPLNAAQYFPTGDVCIDQGLVNTYLASNDSVARISTGAGLTYDRILGASYCICDSTNNCVPPSPSTAAGATQSADERADILTTVEPKPSGAVSLGDSFVLGVSWLLCLFICTINVMQ